MSVPVPRHGVPVSLEAARKCAKILGVVLMDAGVMKIAQTDPPHFVAHTDQWLTGIQVELDEHGPYPGGNYATNLVKDNLLVAARIALAHLMREHERYYDYLAKMEKTFDGPQTSGTHALFRLE